MENQVHGKIRKAVSVIALCLTTAACLNFCGCVKIDGYSNESLFTEDISSVYVEMFDNQSFKRGIEYELTDALAKRIEAETPYKVISSRNRADTIISGRIISAQKSLLSSERETGRPMEKQAELTVVVSWKNLKTGQLLIDNTSLSASASYSEWQNQGFSYAATLTANKLAERIVELMEKQW
ncbi:MAG: LptE family protein [Planctomycetes bacterium]|nr:LptE family protein [Planctomycetota bacterium]